MRQGSCALKQKTIHERKKGKEKKLDTLSSIDPLYQTIESLTALDGVQPLFHLSSSGLLFQEADASGSEQLFGKVAYLCDKGFRIVIVLQDGTRYLLEHLDGIAAHRDPILALMEKDPEEEVCHAVGERLFCKEFKEEPLDEGQQPH